MNTAESEGAVSARCLFTKRTRRGLADRSGNREALALQNEPIAAVPKPLYKTNSGGVSRRAHGRPINDSGSNLVREFSRYKTSRARLRFYGYGPPINGVNADVREPILSQFRFTERTRRGRFEHPRHKTNPPRSEGDFTKRTPAWHGTGIPQSGFDYSFDFQRATIPVAALCHDRRRASPGRMTVKD
jgi:hypothetical protein